jgi:hypothetical protein
MNTTQRSNIINDLANRIPQKEIAKQNDCSQQNISHFLKLNKFEVERLRHKLITKLSSSMVNRALKESRKADIIVSHYDTETMDIPDKDQADYLRQHDTKIVGLIKGILAPNTSETNINVTKNEQNITTAINGDVLKMFHSGANALLDDTSDVSDADVIEADIVDKVQG